jgi:hypothetical protein
MRKAMEEVGARELSTFPPSLPAQWLPSSINLPSLSHPSPHWFLRVRANPFKVSVHLLITKEMPFDFNVILF